MKKLIAVCLVVLSSTAMAKFTNETGLSIITTGGNTETETYNLKTESKKTWDKDAVSFGGHYTLGTAGEENVETVRNWDIFTQYTRSITKKLGAFLGAEFEGNEFAGYKQRQNYDAGARYQFIDTDENKFFSELGLRYTIEQTTDTEEQNGLVRNDTKGNLYLEWEQVLNVNVNYKFWVRYLPNFTRGEDYQINFEPSLNVTLSKSFSLSLGYTGRYDNQLNPGAEERLDWTYTTSLIAKF
jgi:putative salt-induced outer membrane protein YdiY